MQKYTREQYLQMIPQSAVKQCFIDAPGFNAAWDYCVTSEGKHYIPCCAEGTFPEYVKLYEYLPDTNEMKLLFDLENSITVYPRTIRPSKFHTSINPMPDGKLIMTTHTTASAPGHPCWMPEAYYTHMWEGYMGSNVIVYDPETGKVEDFGIPVPRDSVYGAKYIASINALFFITYNRGHAYLFSLDDRSVIDFGQCTELGTYHLHEASDGNIYFSTRSGDLWRFNVQTKKAEYTGVEIPREDTTVCRTNNVFAYSVNGADGRIYFVTHTGRHFFAYDPKDNSLEKLAFIVPAGMREDYPDSKAFGMVFDEYGKLWYTVHTNKIHLCSIDIENPEAEPHGFGLVGTEKRCHDCVENIFIRDDILYMSDANHGPDAPGVVSVDLRKVRRYADTPGIICQDEIAYITRNNELRNKDLYNGNLEKDSKRIADFYDQERRDAEYISQNPFSFGKGEKYVCKLWKKVGPEGSQVYKVSYDEDGNVIAFTEGGKRVVSKNGEIIKIDNCEKIIKEAELTFDDYILPAHPGRQYLAKASAYGKLSDGSFVVGTKDGMLALIKNGKVFSLGAVCNDGAVHDIAVTPDGKRAFGVAGDRDSLGVVFSFDTENGVEIGGRIYFTSGASRERTGVSSEPCCIAASPDGKRVAIGVRDNLGCVYEFEI
ncbi:MAG: PQQ-like beta-propeller repeat protein [Oscillospiraceae bacterium]|nr:PQQ-like beta-propeller repeat protein [Oscillospiraceae bacterium]